MASEPGFLPRDGLDRLIEVLRRDGREVIGPRVRDGAIVYAPIATAADLPTGVRDAQSPGAYALNAASSAERQFAWANGPQALKPLVFSPRERLWTSWHAPANGLHFGAAAHTTRPTAVIGVRACDLAALDLQDRHFLREPYADPAYRARRESLFLVAVHCTHPADTCFCVSTGDGPEAAKGFDLALHEIDAGFVVTSGSNAGAEVLASLPLAVPAEAQRDEARAGVAAAAAAQTRRLPARDLRPALLARIEDPHWQVVAERCLSCGNCTAVCPTCFCNAEIEEPVSDGSVSEHFRQWDSCFTAGHSRLHGIVVRADTLARYRQWLIHKLATWHDQYGRSGCVGCGRCIAWCPVGIDLTAEVAVLCDDGEGVAP
ncbi:sulfite reductase subunit A [Acidihalobacter yilgarnensis]|uniref:Sulfite reductase subunit A n=1 Tax=Acidihalobacter yilgarnensis TaxID=2819280 RepID=A0A1D8ILQ8_9GAMM|nr:4Fe-4S dicluster domain-containing protein [Acidihalobacter yilgarnensis]AOU97399.1 sulfite reductase subunit A [Acidihalobacter yilgarnensis]